MHVCRVAQFRYPKIAIIVRLKESPKNHVDGTEKKESKKKSAKQRDVTASNEKKEQQQAAASPPKEQPPKPKEAQDEVISFFRRRRHRCIRQCHVESVAETCDQTPLCV